MPCGCPSEVGRLGRLSLAARAFAPARVGSFSPSHFSASPPLRRLVVPRVMAASSPSPSWREAARRGFSREDWRAECVECAEAARDLSDSALIAGVRRWTARLNEAGPGSSAWGCLVPWAEFPRGPIVGYAVPTFAKTLLELDAAHARDSGAERVWVDWATGGEARPPERGFEGLGEDGDASGVSARSLPPSLALNASLSTPSARTEALGALLRAAKESGAIVGWRDEPYPVSLRRRGLRREEGAEGSSPSFCVERASAKLLGIKAYGVHLNLYTGSFESPSSLRLWLARRSRAKPTWPGRLDNAVAGGQPSGLGIVENARKECIEEAGVDAESLRRIRPAGAISYASAMVGLTASGLDVAEGSTGAGEANASAAASGPSSRFAPFSVGGEVSRDVMFVADLPLSSSFVPTPADGEAEGFALLPAKDALRIAASTDLFKDNCNLVVADFCIRAGLLDPDADGYLELVEELRWGECK